MHRDREARGETEKPEEVTHETTAVTPVHPSPAISETGWQETALKGKDPQGWGSVVQPRRLCVWQLLPSPHTNTGKPDQGGSLAGSASGV